MPERDSKNYKDELAAAQARLANRFERATKDPEQLVPFAHELADTLRGVAARDELWSDLEECTPTELDELQLRQLMLVDWEAFLQEQGIENAMEIAGDLVSAASRAREGQGSWVEVRELLTPLADRLDVDAIQAESSEKRGLLKALRERAASGVAVLRRISGAALLIDAVKSAGEVAVPPLIAGAVAAVALPPAFAILCAAAAVGGLAWKTTGEVKRSLGEIKQEQIDAFFNQLCGELHRQGTSVAPLRLRELREIGRLGAPSTSALR